MARSRSGGEDQKQVLTITLVLFVLLSIILTVIAYFGYADQGELEKKLVAAKAVAKKAGEERDANLVQMVALKNMIGLNLATKEEQEKFEGNRNQVKGENGKMVFVNVTEPHKDITWDPNQKLPENTYMDLIKKLKAAATKSSQAQKAMEEQAKKNEQQYQQNILALKKANEDMKKALDDTSVMIEKKFKDIDARYKEHIDKLVQAMPNFEKQEKQIRELEQERDKALGTVKRLLADAENQRKKLEEKIPQLDLLAYELPKGKITDLDREGKTAYLNLGTADAARPGLTFSVWSPGQYKPELPQKGRVEIVQVLDKHLSIAKVTETRSPTRDPLVKGDELRNPTWTPGLREHVAIAGFIDLVGDGRDGTPELVRMLEKQGVIVDIWLDLRDMSLKGANKDKDDKITRQTSYLIMGDQPDFEAVGGGLAKEGDRRQEGKGKFNDMFTDLHDKAKAKSVTIVDARRFLALMGMKAPVRTKDSDWTHYLLRQPKEGAAADAPAKKEEPKKKEEEK